VVVAGRSSGNHRAGTMQMVIGRAYFRGIPTLDAALSRGWEERFNGFEQVQQVLCEFTLMLRQEPCHPSYFGDRFPGPLYLGGRGSSPLRHGLLDVGAQVCVKAGTHLLGLTLVVLETACQPAIVTLSGSAAVLAVEVFASSRSDGSKELLVASRICAGGLEILPLGVVTTLRHTDYFTGQPSNSSTRLRLICALSGPASHGSAHFKH
jgi:hypothetical protein